MANQDIKHINQFPPVVTVLGHVDHGKTTLLDAIRKTSIAQREFGGITQKIGASSIEIVYEGQKRQITFIDTPGHEAFTSMRSRGAQAADIGILVVSLADGVMPQTRESIHLLHQEKLPFIVALTKSDLPGAQIEKVKQQLLRENVLLEGLGGDVPFLEVSAKTNHNIKELLDLILLSFDMQSTNTAIKANAPLLGIVIESKRDPKVGAKATIVVKNGTLNMRDDVVCDGQNFRVRTLISPLGKQIPTVSVGEAVEVLGMSEALPVGSILTSQENAVQIQQQEATPMQRELKYVAKEDERGKVSLVVCADTEGSLEAITYALPEDVKIMAKKTGEVSEADILLAKSTGAIVVSFNSKIRAEVQKLAMTERVLAKNYNIIYEMIDEITDVLEGRQRAAVEQVFGTAKIMAKFPFEKTFALGIRVLEGRVARGDRIRIMRGEDTIGETTIASLRVGKDTQSKVEKGHEAGLVLATPLDFQLGDMLVCHS